MLEQRLEPFVVGAVDGDLSGPFLALGELLVALRQVRRLHLLGVVGRRVVVGVDAIPALVGIARLGEDVPGFRRLVGREHLRRQLVDRGHMHDVVGFLISAEFNGHARGQDRIRAAHILDLDSGRLLENLEQRQPFLLVGRGIDRQRALGLGS